MDSFMTTTVSAFINPSLEEERRRYLAQIQKDSMRVHIPAIIFLGTIAIVGLFGNSMVLLVYFRIVYRNAFDRRPNASDIFILAIASFDLLTNCVGIPGEIYGCIHSWDHDNTGMCKFQLFFNKLTIVSSATILLAVAVSRYKMICRPLIGNPTSLKTAKIASFIIAVFCFLFATPQIIFNSSHPVTTRTYEYGITLHECTVDAQYSESTGTWVYYGVLALWCFSICITLVVLYVLISIQRWRHSERHGIPVLVIAPATSSNTGNSEDSHRRLKSNNQKCNISSGISTNEVSLESDVVLEMRNTKKEVKKQPKRKVFTRATFMMIIISAVFVVAFVPVLTLNGCELTIPRFIGKLSPTEYAVYKVFLRFYFLNSATNAIIYGLCDARFRKQMSKIICMCKK